MARRLPCLAHVLVLALLGLALLYGGGVPDGAHGQHFPAAELVDGAPAADESLLSAPRQVERVAPKKAYDLLALLRERQGEPLPGYVGGHPFHNRERRLPPGRYREYDVNPKIRGRSRGAERLVIDQRTGKAYYTDDHYRTFIPLE
ncbi:MAG TPA: ribonuclease domain-containing protein [Nitrospira sp.]|nr:ribonuclease domain-containing protein [Nitrospira sp.]